MDQVVNESDTAIRMDTLSKADIEALIRGRLYAGKQIIHLDLNHTDALSRTMTHARLRSAVSMRIFELIEFDAKVLRATVRILRLDHNAVHGWIVPIFRGISSLTIL